MIGIVIAMDLKYEGDDKDRKGAQGEAIKNESWQLRNLGNILDIETPSPGNSIAILESVVVARVQEGRVLRRTCVKTPPSKGPATDAIAHILLIRPIAAGLLRNGTYQVSSTYYTQYSKSKHLVKRCCGACEL
jgi:hypothetical protein